MGRRSLAIGIAGFSAVVAAFTIRGELDPQDRARFVWLFSTAFAAALLCFVPVVLAEVGLAGASLWRASSGIMIAVWLLTMGIFASNRARERRDSPAAARYFGQGPFLLVPSILNLGLQIANVSGVVWEPSAAAYIIGALVWLYAAALVFISIVIERQTT